MRVAALCLVSILAASPALAATDDLPAAFRGAAAEFKVPEKLLLALAWEASHWRADAASAWGGYGLFDLRDGDGGPDVERAAALLGVSPDAIIADPTEQVRAAAALLAWQAELSRGGAHPDPTDLLQWWDAVRGFSGRQEPNLQAMFADYVFEQVNFGLPLDPETGLALAAEPVNHWDLVGPMPPTACDYSGCAQFVAASSSNYSDYSRTASDISYVIVHTVQGSYSGCISWFQNSSASASAHYVVRSSDGAVTQMVLEEDVAWHAGNWSYNLASVGIEHEGYVEDPDTWYTDEMYAGSAALTADIASRNGIPVSRSNILGHNEVPGATHTDPGSGWDWDYYMSLVGEGGGEITGDLIGVVADSDIYNGERLVGAFVWIAETGETTTSDSSGYYRFYDLPLDTYTVHACMDGYAESTCSKDLGSGQNWCSVALEPGDGSCSYDDGSGSDDTGTTPGDDTGTDVGDDTGTDLPDPDTGGPVDATGAPPPGALVPTSEVGRGCGCGAVGGAGWGLGWLAALVVARRRRS